MATQIKTKAERTKELIELGLTENEVDYILTPLSKLKPDQRMIAMSIHERMTKLVRTENELYAADQAEKAAMQDGDELEYEINNEDDLKIHA